MLITSCLPSATTHVQNVAVTQEDPCSVIVMCEFALGSTADSCQVQWRVDGSNETIEVMTLIRNSTDHGGHDGGNAVQPSSWYYLRY